MLVCKVTEVVAMMLAFSLVVVVVVEEGELFTCQFPIQSILLATVHMWYRTFKKVKCFPSPTWRNISK